MSDTPRTSQQICAWLCSPEVEKVRFLVFTEFTKRLERALRAEEEAWGDLNGYEGDAVSGEWLRGFAAQRIDAIRKALRGTEGGDRNG